MDKNIRSVSTDLDMNNPIVKSMIETMVHKGREAKRKFNIGDKVYIDNCDGTYTPALFKGDISDTLALVKPKEKFCKGGYGQTITCLKKLIITKIN